MYCYGLQNSYNVANTIYEPKDVGSEPIEPATAARIYGDKSFFYNCSFVGYQDTLFDAYGRHYYKDCYIEGEIDFIFGSAQSYYEVNYTNLYLLFKFIMKIK